jgi:hypothetical protein
MSDERRPLFEPLEPPPGGLGALRRRLERDSRRRFYARQAVLATAGASLIVGFVVFLALGPGGSPAMDDSAFAFTRISFGLSPAPSEPVSLREGESSRAAVKRVPLDSDRVVFYRVAVVADDPEGVGGTEGH